MSLLSVAKHFGVNARRQGGKNLPADFRDVILHGTDETDRSLTFAYQGEQRHQGQRKFDGVLAFLDRVYRKAPLMPFHSAALPY